MTAPTIFWSGQRRRMRRRPKTSGIDALPFVAKFGEPSLRAVKPISRSRLWLALRSFSEAIPLWGASSPTASLQVAGSNAQILLAKKLLQVD